MSTEVPRLPPPTFEDPPTGLSQIRLTQLLFEENCRPDDRTRARFVVSFKPDGPSPTTTPAELARAVWYALWDVFGGNDYRELAKIYISFEWPPTLADLSGATLQQLSLLESSDWVTISRAWWYERYKTFALPDRVNKAEGTQQDGPVPEQSPAGPLMNSCSSSSSNPPMLIQSDLAPPPQSLYERYIAPLDTYFCLSVFGNDDCDVNILHDWLNDARVDEYWKDAGSREFHVAWLNERYEDAHVLPILGSFRGEKGGDKTVIEPFAYYEIYWAAQDKIAKFHPTDAYDRGIHMLVGSSAHRGPHRVRSWLPSLAHYIFSDDPRTQRILSEPDRRNSKMIGYLEQFGFKKNKEVDMGHKVAAIMVLERSHFWSQCPL